MTAAFEAALKYSVEMRLETWAQAACWIDSGDAMTRRLRPLL